MRNLLLSIARAFSKVTTLGANETLDQVPAAFKGLMQNIIGPVFGVIGVAAVAYVIVLGIQYAKAEDADGRKKVQGRLVGAAVGAIIIIAGCTLCLALPWETIFANFMTNNGAALLRF